MKTLLSLCLCLGATVADNDVVQSSNRGRVNWSARVISVSGNGPPSLKAPNAAVARLGAERTARADAATKLSETLRSLQVSSTDGAATLIDKSPDLKAPLEALIKGFKTLDTRYFADGGVDIVAQMPLDGGLGDLLVRLVHPTSPEQTPEGSPPENTGLVINAKGLKATPALAPRLLDEAGQVLYSASAVGSEALKQRGVTAYTRSLDVALKDARVADKPLIVRALKVGAGAGCDLVIAAADAAKLGTMRSILSQGRVVVVLD